MDLYPIYRTGYVISQEACRRYLEQGCGVRALAPPPPANLADIPLPSNLEEEYDAGEFDPHNWRLEQMADLERTQCLSFGRWFRSIRRHRMDPELTKRLVMLHYWQSDTRPWDNLFLPTGVELRQREEGDIDRQRLQTFIDTCNAYIEDDQLRATAGLKPEDFEYVVVKDQSLVYPGMCDKEYWELLRNPELQELYGIPLEGLKDRLPG
ncbi:hypothetical protein FKP32DRAFT_1759895 [Trametes sanguinea]|nr:hypothetical protein FKP32DRAFT_1759895 [Trametes sanguinea]